MSQLNDRLYVPIIGSVSVVISLVVAVLLFAPKDQLLTLDTRFLPHLNACINSGVSILLVAGFYFVKQKQITYHRACMLGALILSSLFLVSYVLYHSSQAGHVKYGGEGMMKFFYLFILFTHIILALPLFR